MYALILCLLVIAAVVGGSTQPVHAAGPRISVESEVGYHGNYKIVITSYSIHYTKLYEVLIVSAKNQEIDKIAGLGLGADDFVTKPFSPLEVVARIQAQFRRSYEFNEPSYNFV